MTWSRQPLAQYASGYDAVIEITGSVVNQVLAQQASIVLPATRVGPFSVAVPPGAQNISSPFAVSPTTAGTAPVAATAVTLNVAPVGVSSLRLLAAAAQVSGLDVLVRLTLRNETNATVTLVASSTLGSVPRPLSPPVPFGAGATAVLVVPILNVPATTHAIEIRVFDLANPAVQTLLQGTLTFAAITPAVVVGIAGTGPPPVRIPGLETRVTRTLTVDATPGSFSVDLAASVGTNVILACPVTLAIEAITAESVVASRPTSSAFGPGSQVASAIPVSTQYTIENRVVQGALRVTVPLLTAVEPGTRTVSVYCDLAAATLTLTANDPDAQTAGSELVRQFRDALATQAAQRATGSRLELAPRVSLVGSLRPGETVTEVSFQQTTAEVLAATSSSTHAVLAVAMALAGNTRPRSALNNFVDTDNFGAVISGAVLRAVAAFRWRVGDHPRILMGRPNETEYEDHGTKVAILIFPQMHQTSLVDAAGATVTSLRIAGPRTYGTSTGIYTFLMTDAVATTKAHAEDHVLLGGLGDFEIASVLRKDNHQPVPTDVRDKYEAPAELKHVLFQWTFSMSAVAVPTPVADADVEAFLQPMRSGVTQHLSRPFSASHTVVLSMRHANAVDDLLFSRGTLTL